MYRYERKQPYITLHCPECQEESQVSITIERPDSIIEGIICPVCGCEYVITLRRLTPQEISRKQLLRKQARQLTSMN